MQQFCKHDTAATNRTVRGGDYYSLGLEVVKVRLQTVQFSSRQGVLQSPETEVKICLPGWAVQNTEREDSL
jgi:hypothetical protein